MSFILVSGNVQVEYFPKIASVALAVGTVLKSDGSGAVTLATSTDLSVIGVNLKPVVSTDTDYASNTLIPVIVPSPDAVFEVDVETGSAAAANVGIKYDLNSTTGTGINVNGTSHKQFTVTSVLSATKVRGKINASYEFVNAV